MFKCLGFDNWLIEVLRKGVDRGYHFVEALGELLFGDKRNGIRLWL